MSTQGIEFESDYAVIFSGKIKSLFSLDMKFLLIVPALFIVLSSGYLAPFFIFAVIPVLLLWLANVLLLSVYYLKLKRVGLSNLFLEAGKPLLLLMLMIFTIPLGSIGFASRSDYTKSYFKESSVMSDVASALAKYAETHNGQYPDPERWCQELCFDQNPIRFASEMNVVLNPMALELGADKPVDMVLGFVCYNGQWGQVGIYDRNVHLVGKLFHYFTGRWRDKVVRSDQAEYLKWNMEKKPRVDSTISDICGAILFGSLVVLGGYATVRHRSLLKRCIFPIFVIGSLSTISGGLFCSWATMLFEGGSAQRFMGLHGFGMFLGVLFSWCFVLWMAYYRLRCNYEQYAYWATFWGAIAGIICSCYLHLFLMVMYNELTFYPLLAGVPFGAWSGMLLGWWTGRMLDSRLIK